jgi:xanthine dehydrogenase iron-sulfur cluster and FAD-binding subunit A
MDALHLPAPSSLADALAAVASPGSVPIGGGTDLLSTVDEGLLAPARVVDLQSLPDWAAITRAQDGALRLGAGVAIATLGRTSAGYASWHPRWRQQRQRSAVPRSATGAHSAQPRAAPALLVSPPRCGVL